MNTQRNPGSIYDHITQSWKIPPFLQHKLSNHYILHWSPKYLFSKWGTNSPIMRDRVTYLRIYHNCTHGELARCKVVLLSFRKLPDMPYGYVLLTPARSLAHQHITEHNIKSMRPKEQS